MAKAPAPSPPRSSCPSQRWVRCGVGTVVLVLSVAAPSSAVQAGPPAPRTFRVEPVAGSAPGPSRPGRIIRFLGGAGVGLGLHEGSHVLADRAFGVDIDIRRVEFLEIPFFALTHAPGLPAREEYVISSAGIWSQHLSSELILTMRPGMRHERAPFLKGVLAFDVLLSTGYGLAAVAGVGPPERDPRGMAQGLGLSEPVVGGLILAPAVLDTWRYFRPEARWPRRLSRVAKVSLVLVAFADLPL